MQIFISLQLWSTRIPLAHRECVTYPVILSFPHLSHQPPPGSISGLRDADPQTSAVPGGTRVVLSGSGVERLSFPHTPLQTLPTLTQCFFLNKLLQGTKSNHPVQFCPLKQKTHGCANSPGRTNPLGHIPQQQHRRNWCTLTSPGSRQCLQPRLLQPIPFFLWETSGDRKKQQ